MRKPRFLENSIEALKKYSFFETFLHAKNYFSAIVLNNALGIIALPVYTALLSPADYGIVNLFNSLAQAMAILVTLNSHAAVSRYYYEEKEDYKEFIGTTAVTASLLTSISLVLFILFYIPFFKWMNIPLDTAVYLFPYVLVYIITNIYQQLFIARKESFEVAKVNTLMNYGKFILSLVFIYLMHKAYVGKIAGDVGFAVLLGVYMLYKLRAHIKLKFSREHLSYIFLVSLPLLPHALSSLILHYFDQLMINITLGNTDTGLYSFAYKIGLIFLGLVAALMDAGSPDFYKWMNNSEEDRIRSQEKSLIKFMLLGAACLMLFAQDLGHLLASNKVFTESLFIVPIIIGGYLCYGIYSHFSRLILYSKRNIWISAITITGGVVNIILNTIFIKKFGYQAAAWTTLVSYAVMLVMGVFACRYIIGGYFPSLSAISILIIPFLIVLAVFMLVSSSELAYLWVFLIKASLLFFLLFWFFGTKIMEQWNIIRKQP